MAAPSNIKPPRRQLGILVLCAIPGVVMLATKAGDTLEWWALVTVKHHPFLNRLFGPLDFLRNLGMLLGLPLGLLSLIIAILYLTFRFRRMSRGYQVAFVVLQRSDNRRNVGNIVDFESALELKTQGLV